MISLPRSRTAIASAAANTLLRSEWWSAVNGVGTAMM
jgi:hypothetical protein